MRTLMADEAPFQAWYQQLSKKLGISPNPDDPEHYYDYRAFYRDMKAGKVTSPDAPGGHFTSAYKTAGHPRTYLDDGQGRVFDTRSAQYLTGDQVPDEQLTASEQSPDKPNFDAKRLMKAGPAIMAFMRGR